MPYKSDAQRRYFHAAESRGEISHKTVKEFDTASKGKELPEKVKKHAHGGLVHTYSTGGAVKENKHLIAKAIESMKQDEAIKKNWRGG